MKKLVILLAGLGLLTPKSWAEDAKPPVDLATTLEQLQLKLDHAGQRANQPVSGGSNVVGLRGSKQESGSKELYWKDKPGATPVTTDEVKSLRAAVDLARAGKNVEATADLKAFLDKYPKSALRSDAEDTLKLLNPPAPAPITPTPQP